MHIVITGASSGIGESVARELATLPEARLTLVARRQDKLEALAKSLPAPCEVAVQDLAELTDPGAWLRPAIQRFGPVEVLVNNAGVQVVANMADVDVEQGERSVALNLLMPLRLVRAVLGPMTARKQGIVVNIASMAAIAPTPRMAYYNASKAGLAAASEALIGELRGTGVRVLTVYPGILSETELAQRTLAIYEDSAAVRFQPTGSVVTLAQKIRRRVEGGRSGRIIYPRVNVLARWFPGITRWVLDRFAPGLRKPKPSKLIARADA